MFKIIHSVFASPERFLNIISHGDIQESIADGDRIIIDEDGNAMVNTRNQAVQEDFARHVAALRRA